MTSIYEVLYTVNADNWVEVIVWLLLWDGKLQEKLAAGIIALKCCS